VLAVDLAGNTSAPVHARRAPGAEAADRAWVDTDAGRALCGRTGSARRQRLACTVLTDSGWRRVPLTRVTDWGHAGSRHFVATADGGAAYCRTVGRASRPRAACTTLDAATLTWGVDVISGRRVPLRPESRTWTATDAGPALCGLSGRPSRPRVGCALLTAAGWRWSAPDRAAAWGAPTSRAFVAGDETLSFCRAVGAGASGASLSCTPFYVRTLRWGYDRASSSPDRGGARTGPTEGTWVATVRGPALCASTPSGTGCRVLTSAGWRFVKARTGGAAADEQAFVAESGTVSWCRTLSTRAGASYRTACTRLDPDRLRWGRDRVGRRSRSLEPASRTWVGTDAGPALCGLSGRAHRSQVGCHVLRRDGWGAVEGLASARGETDYRAFVPSAGGVAFCRTVGRASVACTALGADLTWGRTERSGRVGRTYADSW
jgi:hypothetical protein